LIDPNFKYEMSTVRRNNIERARIRTSFTSFEPEYSKPEMEKQHEGMIIGGFVSKSA
jgi:hypothetical protein